MAQKHGIPATSMKAEYKDGKQTKRGEQAIVKGKIVSIKSELKEFTNSSMRKLNIQLELENGSRVFVKRDEFVNDEIRLYPQEFGGDFIEVDLMEVEDYRDTHRIPTIKLKGENDTEVNKEHLLISMELAGEKFKVGDIIRVLGTLEFDDYNPQTYIKPNAIYFSGKFEEKDPKALQATKRFVLAGVEQNKETKKIEATLYHITDKEVFMRVAEIENKALATNLKKHCKPFSAIDLSVEFSSSLIEEDVEIEQDASDEFDGWGMVEDFQVAPKQAVEYVHKLVIVGANPKSIVEDVYSEEIIMNEFKKDDETTIQAEAEEGWGNGFDSTESEDSFPF